MDIKGAMQKVVAGAGILIVTVFAGKVMVDENQRRQMAFKKAEERFQKCDQNKVILAEKGADRFPEQILIPARERHSSGKADRLTPLPMQTASNRSLPQKNETATSYNLRGVSSQKGHERKDNKPLNQAAYSSNITSLPKNNRVPQDRAGNGQVAGNRAKPNRQSSIICPEGLPRQQQKRQFIPKRSPQDTIPVPDMPTKATKGNDLSEGEPETDNRFQPNIAKSAKKLWVNNSSSPETDTPKPSYRRGGMCGK